LEKSSTPLEALDGFFPDSAARRWFHLRARHISTALDDVARDARGAAKRPLAFGIDVFPPSVAALGGHMYNDLGCLDYLTGGFGIIGWDSVGLATCREWTRFLCSRWTSLDEGLVLRNLYRMFGYEGLSLPEQVKELEHPTRALKADVATREIERMARSKPTGPQVYPPISLSSYDEEGVRKVCRAIVGHGLDGVMLAGLEDVSPDWERVLADTLPRT
jgi:hypothetical protein